MNNSAKRITVALAGWVVAWFAAQWAAPHLAPHLPLGEIKKKKKNK